MRKIIFIAMALLLLTGCADSVSFDDAKGMDQVGFIHGFWHGAILVFSFAGSLFSDDIAVYAIYNNGGWYDLGFLMGAGALTSTATKSKEK